MFDSDGISLDCSTCVAVNTTACGDCVVQHLLANDAGPIEFVPGPRRRVVNDTERVIGLFERAGLLADEAHFVAFDEFESVDAPQMSR